MNRFSIEVDKEDLKKAKAAFRNLEAKAPQKLKNAINRTLTQAKNMVLDGEKEAYTMKPSRFKRDIQTIRAKPGNLSAWIKSKGRPPSVQSYKHGYTKKQGGKVQVLRANKYGPVGPAGRRGFMLPGGKAAGMMAVRAGRTRKPLNVLHGPSIPNIVKMVYTGQRGSQGNLQSKVQERLAREIEKEIEKLTASKG